MNFIPPIENLGKHIEDLAQINNTSIIVCDIKGEQTQKLSYRELFSKIQLCASWLMSLGLKEGDRVAIGFSNSAELLVLNWAAWSTGIVTVPLDTKRDTVEDQIYKLKTTSAKFLIVKDGEEVTLKDFKVVKFDYADTAKEIKWKKGLDHEALILFTSGTTGHPKGAKLSLQNLIANAEGIKEWFEIDETDRFMVLLPLHHINSTTFTFSTLLAGGSIAIPPSYSASNFWNQAAKTESTFTSIVPTIGFDQLSKKEQYDSVKKDLNLKKIQIGSAPVVSSDVRAFMKLYEIKMFQGYGQTETALRVSGIPLDLEEDLYLKLVDENSIGTPMKWADIFVLDGAGNELGPDTEGELAVKGPIIMEGYLGNEEAFKNGYFMTGDLGYFKKIDDKKFFYIQGRIKEIIIKGGVNISPVSVEEKIKLIDSAVEQAYVVGYPDKRYGEDIAAVICWKDDENRKDNEARLKYLLGKKLDEISEYEKPSYITTIKAEDLPMTSTRKVQRTELKKIPLENFVSTEIVAEYDERKYLRLTAGNKKLMQQAFELFNYCWAPMTIDNKTFSKHVSNGLILIGVENNEVRGVLSVVLTKMNSGEILQTNYNEFTSELTMSSSDDSGKNMVLVSLCSSNYKPRDIPDIAKPDKQAVEKYLKEGNDSVMKFHRKPKAGLDEGAKLVGVIPDGRPEDKMALGYNMLLKYPELNKAELTDSSMAVQLIESAMILAKSLEIKNIFAYSRPADLAKYLSENS